MLATPNKPSKLNAVIYPENFTPEERNVFYKLLSKAVAIPKPSVWKPSFGEEFWVVTGYGTVTKYAWTDIDTDEAYYSMNNCFLTKESAEFAAERLKVFAELQQYADENNECLINWRDTTDKWFFTFNYTTEELGYSYTVRNRVAETVYFTSSSVAIAAVEAIGESRIKKYLFEAEDETETDHA